jgi:hypothetical protein
MPDGLMSDPTTPMVEPLVVLLVPQTPYPDVLLDSP